MSIGQFLLNELHGVEMVAQHTRQRGKDAFQQLGEQFALTITKQLKATNWAQKMRKLYMK